MDPYEVLGVRHDAPMGEIRAAYHRLARRHHPDVHADSAAAQARASARMTDINIAYRRVLQDRDRGSERPPETVGPRGPSRDPLCTLHAADMVYGCPSCGEPACGECLTATGCVRCPRREPARHASPLWAWVPVAAGLLVIHLLAPAPRDIGWGALAYLFAAAAIAGWRSLVRQR